MTDRWVNMTLSRPVANWEACVEYYWARFWHRYESEIQHEIRRSRGGGSWIQEIERQIEDGVRHQCGARVDVRVVVGDDEIIVDVREMHGQSYSLRQPLTRGPRRSRDPFSRDLVVPPRDDRADALTYGMQALIEDLSPTRDSKKTRQRDGVSLLLSICRAVADARALEIHHALSMRRHTAVWRLGARHSICEIHGYVRDHALGSLCGRCEETDKRRALVRWAVEWLLTVARGLVDVLVRSLSDAVESLRSVVLQAGAALWESLDDWTKRVHLLELDRTPYYLVGGVDRDDADLRFSLIERD